MEVFGSIILTLLQYELPIMKEIGRISIYRISIYRIGLLTDFNVNAELNIITRKIR